MQNKLDINNKYSKLIMFIPVFFILMPRPNISGIQFLTYPAIVFLVAIVVMVMTKDIVITRSMFLLFTFIFFTIFEMVLSMMINTHIDIGSLARPILIASVLYFGNFITKNYKDKKIIKNSLLKAAYLIIFVQFIVGMTQLFGIDLFSFLYSTEKTRAWGGIVRIAGTMMNPNMFSWILIQMMVIIWLFEKKSFKKLSSLMIVLGLVFLSGSRSLLLIFPFVLIFVEIFSKRKTASFFFVKVPLYGGVLFLAYRVLVWFLSTPFGANFRYMRELLSIFESRDLNSIGSFAHRESMWQRALTDINSPLSWIFGTGGAIEKADNDYVYAISNFGIAFLVIQLSMYLLIAYLFYKIKDRKFRALGLQYIVFSLGLGYQVETLSGWNYPILIMFYTGIAISVLATMNAPEVVEQPISQKKRYKKGIKLGNKRLVW